MSIDNYQYVINGKKGYDPRGRYEEAMCLGCRAIVDVIEPKQVDASDLIAWRDRMRTQGFRTGCTPYRRRYLERACSCGAET